MNRLTPKQANLLRELRKQLNDAVNSIAHVAGVLDTSCPHDEGYDDECPVCTLARRLHPTATLADAVTDDLDRFLLNGPHPEEKPRA